MENFEDDGIELVVDGHDYYVTKEQHNEFKIADSNQEDFAEIKVSECGEYYIHEYSPEYSNFDNDGGSTYITNFDSFVDFCRWVISANQ